MLPHACLLFLMVKDHRNHKALFDTPSSSAQTRNHKIQAYGANALGFY